MGSDYILIWNTSLTTSENNLLMLLNFTLFVPSPCHLLILFQLKVIVSIVLRYCRKNKEMKFWSSQLIFILIFLINAISAAVLEDYEEDDLTLFDYKYNFNNNVKFNSLVIEVFCSSNSGISLEQYLLIFTSSVVRKIWKHD